MDGDLNTTLPDVGKNVINIDLGDTYILEKVDLYTEGLLNEYGNMVNKYYWEVSVPHSCLMFNFKQRMVINCSVQERRI